MNIQKNKVCRIINAARSSKGQQLWICMHLVVSFSYQSRRGTRVSLTTHMTCTFNTDPFLSEGKMIPIFIYQSTYFTISFPGITLYRLSSFLLYSFFTFFFLSLCGIFGVFCCPALNLSLSE